MRPGTCGYCDYSWLELTRFISFCVLWWCCCVCCIFNHPFCLICYAVLWCYHAGRRTTLPAPCADNSHIGIMTILYNNIGKDLSRVSMPVALNEPLSLLQRLSEELEYSELLDIASNIDDPYERMVCWDCLWFLTHWGSNQVEFGVRLVEDLGKNLFLSCLFLGLCSSILHLWLCLGILEESLQTLQPCPGWNVWELQRRQRIPIH